MFVAHWKRYCIIASLSLLLGVATLLYRVRQGDQARKEVITLFQSLNVGMKASEIQPLIDSQQSRLLRLHEISADLLFVQTPLEWGARNWVLWLELSDGTVSAVRIRVHDSRELKPHGAPPDRTVTE